MAQVVAISVHPAVGIARVGNSDIYFIGPEQPGVNPVPDGGYKDQLGKLKKQAARFRVFTTLDNGNSEEFRGPINWTVELTNKKAAATGFGSTELRNAKAP